MKREICTLRLQISRTVIAHHREDDGSPSGPLHCRIYSSRLALLRLFIGLPPGEGGTGSGSDGGRGSSQVSAWSAGNGSLRASLLCIVGGEVPRSPRRDCIASSDVRDFFFYLLAVNVLFRVLFWCAGVSFAVLGRFSLLRFLAGKPRGVCVYPARKCRWQSRELSSTVVLEFRMGCLRAVTVELSFRALGIYFRECLSRFLSLVHACRWIPFRIKSDCRLHLEQPNSL